MDQELKSDIRRIEDHLASIDKTLIKQEASLDKHIMRTEQNEKLIAVIMDDMKPIKKHINQLDGALKFLGILSLVSGIILSILKLVGVI